MNLPVSPSLPKAQQRQEAQQQHERVRRLVFDLCAAAVHKTGDEERVAMRLEDVERATVVVRAVFLVNRDLGLWIIEQVSTCVIDSLPVCVLFVVDWCPCSARPPLRH